MRSRLVPVKIWNSTNQHNHIGIRIKKLQNVITVARKGWDNQLYHVFKCCASTRLVNYYTKIVIKSFLSFTTNNNKSALNRCLFSRFELAEIKGCLGDVVLDEVGERGPALAPKAD